MKKQVMKKQDGECEGHPAGPHDQMGVTVYCDGSCTTSGKQRRASDLRSVTHGTRVDLGWRREQLTALPVVGDDITENMGRYRVIKALGGSLFEVISMMGSRITIDFTNSGYRDPSNAWRVVETVGAA